MRTRQLLHLLVASATMQALAAEPAAEAKKAPDPHPVVKSFYVDGVNDQAAADRIVAAIEKLPSVTDVKELTPSSGYVRVAFDTHVITSHLVAQAMLDNGATDVRIAFRIPDYSQNAGKLDALFAKIESERSVKIEAKDKTKGEFKLAYLPISPDPGNPRKAGFNYGHLGHPVHDPPPKGLGLSFQMLDVPPTGGAVPRVKRTPKN